MLKELFPTSHQRYTSLPILGSVVEDFEEWLSAQRYKRRTRQWLLYRVFHIDAFLRQGGFHDIEDVAREDLDATCSRYTGRNRRLKGTASVLCKFLKDRGLLRNVAPCHSSKIDSGAKAYSEYLRVVRGFGDSSVRNHTRTLKQFLAHFRYEEDPSRLRALDSSDIEAFIRHEGKRLTRGSLQHTVAHVRAFLRFFASKGQLRPGLDSGIDSPRHYRLEKLPRALPWGTVRKFLDSIDRTTPIGIRDYTMFFLIATYGLRSCEIVSLTLDDIRWRRREIRIPSRKNGESLLLPLTDDAGSVLLGYLGHRRPAGRYRQLFLRTKAPSGPLKSTTPSETFRVRLQRSGLDIPLQGGCHCLRHSFAVHLLRLGTPLKTIGDLLGHRLAESTCMYLRLATEDLRGVALPLPQEVRETSKEVQS